MNANSEDIKTIMLIWSVCIGVGILANVVAGGAMMSQLPNMTP